MERVQVTIIGSGPAGLTAAIYTGRANLKPVVFEGIEPGGQLTTTTIVENYPGFSDGINGPDLMDQIRNQALRFGAKLHTDEVTSVDLSERPFTVKYGSGEILRTETLVIASGASAKWIGLDSEQRLRGYGVSSCATCDGFFFNGKRVAVVGGGDTAMEDALHLTRFATEVVIIHRRDELRASKIMQDRALKNPKITFQWNAVVAEVMGSPETGVQGLTLKDTQTGKLSKLDIDGLFVAIGHHPNTEFLEDQISLDENGFVVSEEQVTTNVSGVFVAGDVVDPRYRQAITAAGMGCMAALELQEFIEMNPLD
jgi:thioredoxin reductase (NADPH)